MALMLRTSNLMQRRLAAPAASVAAARAFHAARPLAAELSQAGAPKPAAAAAAATTPAAGATGTVSLSGNTANQQQAAPEAAPAAGQSALDWLNARRAAATAQSIRDGFWSSLARVQPAIRSAADAVAGTDAHVAGIASITPAAVDAGKAGDAPTVVTIEHADTTAATAGNAAVQAVVQRQQSPEFSVVSAGLGAMLVASIPPGTKVYAQKGTNVGQSANITTFVSASGGPFHSAMRALQGGPFFFQVFSTPRAESGDVLIAPKGIGDVAVLDMDGSAEYYVRRHAYLASTGGVSLGMRLGNLSLTTDTGIVHYRAAGKGKLAITTYGGLYRLVLAAGETYRISPKYLIAWDTGMTPEAVPADVATGKGTAAVGSESSLAVATTTTAPVTDSDGTAAVAPTLSGQVTPWVRTVQVFREMAGDLGVTLRGVAKRARSKVQYWALGQEELVELTGPGDVYIASRILPRFDLLRNISATNAEEKKQQAADTNASKAVAGTPHTPGPESTIAAGLRKPVIFDLKPKPASTPTQQ
ncbi:hypothetical protein H9P43_004820 [Blastocladiella emersonii ATCC 22665]|nr:hypothetical protein H9P43_004820 [Blastocladiella emersonii ATCC 22665]